MKTLFLISLFYLNTSSATMLDDTMIATARSDADLTQTYKPDENVKNASQAVYDNYVNFFKQPNKTKDAELYSKFNDSNLCLLSFLTAEEFNVMSAVHRAAEKDVYDLDPSSPRRYDFLALAQTYPEPDLKMTSDNSKERSKCQFKIDQKALDVFNEKAKADKKLTNENYDALMNLKKTTRPEIRQLIETNEKYVEGSIEKEKSKGAGVSDEYKKILFTSFAKIFKMQNDILMEKSHTMFKGECIKISEDLYTKSCFNKSPYKDIPGEGFKKIFCFMDNSEALEKKCAPTSVL